MPAVPAAVVRRLVQIGREFHARGWVLGTSGNFSAVLSQGPAAARDHGQRRAQGRAAAARPARRRRRWPAGRVTRRGKPSAETLLHLVIARPRGAGAVLHTHSVWSTMLSERHAAAGGLAINGFEMLKGLDGVRTHEHSRVDSDRRQRSGHRAPRRRRATPRSTALRTHMPSCSAGTGCTLGAQTSTRRAARRDSRVSARSDRSGVGKRAVGPAQENASWRS